MLITSVRTKYCTLLRYLAVTCQVWFEHEVGLIGLKTEGKKEINYTSSYHHFKPNRMTEDIKCFGLDRSVFRCDVLSTVISFRVLLVVTLQRV